VSVEHFAALGMTLKDAAARTALVDRVSHGFAARVGEPADWRWFVPGRIEVFGKHTDYAGGRSLFAAVPRGFAVAARPRPDRLIRVMDVRHGSEAVIDPDDRDHTATGWVSYVQVVARRFASNFPEAPLGVDLAIASDLPRAAGLSSSSALVVAVATVLIRRAGLESRPEWSAAIASQAELAWYLGCVENGLDFRTLSGTAGVGTHGGSEDHTAIITGRPGHVTQCRFMPVEHLGDVAMPAAWTFVIASSGVHADKAGSVKERFNRAALAVRALLAVWNRDADTPAASLASVLVSPDAMTRLVARVKAAPTGGFTAADLLQRLEHFMNEDARVPSAARAFAEADADALGDLSDASQRDADESLHNQVPETCALADLARQRGALAASSFGAGFGGSVWALIEADRADRFAADWQDVYARRCPHVASNMEVFAARPGPAVTEVPLGTATA
jgi:galactokinase